MTPLPPEKGAGSNPPLVFDVSRILRRGARPPSGIDRVDRAYAAWVKSRGGIFCAYDRGRWHALAPFDVEAALPDLPAPSVPLWRNRAARRLTLALKHLPRTDWGAGFHFVSTGHNAIPRAGYDAMREIGARSISVMVHDCLPLDAPEFSKPQSVPRFRRFLDDATQQADLLICNSEDTRARVRHLSGREAGMCVAPLGIESVGHLQRRPEDGHVIYVSTLEPRKNHAFLLRVWRDVVARANRPMHLHLVGRMGWLSKADAARLQRDIDAAPHVRWHKNITDEALSALMSRMSAAVFPSLAEGFGLPVYEAALAGVPVLASDLPVFAERPHPLIDCLPVDDENAWVEALLQLGRAQKYIQFDASEFGWRKHFEMICREIDKVVG